MFFNLALLTLLGSVSALKINTPPSLIECQPVQVTWGEGTGPYYPAVIPGGQASATALKTFDKTDGSSLTWNVDLPAGTDVTIRITDGSGASAFTSQLIVQKGTDQSCLTSGSDSSSAATSGAGSSDSSAAADAAPSAAASSPASGSSSSGSGAVQAGAAAVSAAASGAASAAGTGAAAVSSAAAGAAKPSAAGASAAASATPVSGAGRVGAGIAAVAGAALFAMAF